MRLFDWHPFPSLMRSYLCQLLIFLNERVLSLPIQLRIPFGSCTALGHRFTWLWGFIFDISSSQMAGIHFSWKWICECQHRNEVKGTVIGQTPHTAGKTANSDVWHGNFLNMYYCKRQTVRKDGRCIERVGLVASRCSQGSAAAGLCLLLRRHQTLSGLNFFDSFWLYMDFGQSLQGNGLHSNAFRQ
jgi:hypothetical protein